MAYGTVFLEDGQRQCREIKACVSVTGANTLTSQPACGSMYVQPLQLHPISPFDHLIPPELVCVSNQSTLLYANPDYALPLLDLWLMNGVADEWYQDSVIHMPIKNNILWIYKLAAFDIIIVEIQT